MMHDRKRTDGLARLKIPDGIFKATNLEYHQRSSNPHKAQEIYGTRGHLILSKEAETLRM